MLRHHPRFFCFAFLLTISISFSTRTSAQDEGDAWAKKKSSWLLLIPSERTKVQDFSEDYKNYLNIARSALGSTREVLRRAHAAGFTEFSKPEQVTPGARLLIPNRDRSLILAVIGTDPFVDGSRVVGTHQDSPHIELKARRCGTSRPQKFPWFFRVCSSSPSRWSLP